MRWFQSSKEYGYVIKKNFNQKYKYIRSKDGFEMDVKTNSYGHRFKEYDQNKLSNSNYKKIMLLGDSFIFGHGVNMEDHIATHLDSLLSILDTNFQIINAGIGGWGTLQETKYAVDNFDAFNPDIIALIFCGNDPLDDISFKAGMADNEKGLFYFPGKVFLRNNSHLYRFLITKLKLLIHQKYLNSKTKEKDAIYNRQSSTSISEKDWENTLSYIRNFHKNFIEYNDEGMLFIGATSPWDIDIKNKLGSLENGENIIYIDLYEQTKFLDWSDRKLAFDGHWSPLIHKIFAEEIYKTIKQKIDINN